MGRVEGDDAGEGEFRESLATRLWGRCPAFYKKHFTGWPASRYNMWRLTDSIEEDL